MKCLQKKGLGPKAIPVEMVITLRDDVPALSTVLKWATEFRRGREGLKDDPNFGCLVTATTEENIDHVHYMVIDDR